MLHILVKAVEREDTGCTVAGTSSDTPTVGQRCGLDGGIYLMAAIQIALRPNPC